MNLFTKDIVVSPSALRSHKTGVFVTITTVGYGDCYPVTSLGRVIAVVLMGAGVGLFGTFTAYVASFFIEHEQEETTDEIKELIDEVKALRKDIEELKKR